MRGCNTLAARTQLEKFRRSRRGSGEKNFGVLSGKGRRKVYVLPFSGPGASADYEVTIERGRESGVIRSTVHELHYKEEPSGAPDLAVKRMWLRKTSRRLNPRGPVRLRQYRA